MTSFFSCINYQSRDDVYYVLYIFINEKKKIKITDYFQVLPVSGLSTEKCYHVELFPGKSLSDSDKQILRWILKNPQAEDTLTKDSSLIKRDNHQILIEIGPRFNFSTPDSTNSVAICQSAHLGQVCRLEVSIRYLITFDKEIKDEESVIPLLLTILSDRMTQCQYTATNIPKESFNEQLPKSESSWRFIPLLQDGRKALEKVNTELGLAFDNWDLEFYTNLFQNVLKRDPTTVELFDLAQSNSEHSRHWFFRGRMIVDQVEQEKSLIRMIIDTQEHTNQNNTIKFSDNSSAIKGYKHKTIVTSTEPGAVKVVETESDLIFTAETHNMPTAVCPFSGATTGTGGRIR